MRHVCNVGQGLIHLGMKKECEVCNTPAGRLVVASDIRTEAMMLMLRECAYKRNVLLELGIKYATVMQLVMLDNYLRRRRMLYASIAQVRDSEPYKYWARTPTLLAQQYDVLVAGGYMVKTSRERVNGRGHVVVWGLTAKGKGLLLEFYEWIAGKHDDVLGL